MWHRNPSIITRLCAIVALLGVSSVSADELHLGQLSDHQDIYNKGDNKFYHVHLDKVDQEDNLVVKVSTDDVYSDPNLRISFSNQ